MAPLDRKSLRRCVACGKYHPLNRLVGQTFRAGKHRFHLCVDCWHKDTEQRCCSTCGDVLTVANAKLKATSSGYRVASMRCMKCINKIDALNERIKHYKRVLPHIIK